MAKASFGPSRHEPPRVCQRECQRRGALGAGRFAILSARPEAVRRAILAASCILPACPKAQPSPISSSTRSQCPRKLPRHERPALTPRPQWQAQLARRETHARTGERGRLKGIVEIVGFLPPMYRAPPGAYARPVEVLDQSFIRSNDSLGRPPLYSPSLGCRVVHIKPRYSSKPVFNLLAQSHGAQHVLNAGLCFRARKRGDGAAEHARCCGQQHRR